MMGSFRFAAAAFAALSLAALPASAQSISAPGSSSTGTPAASVKDFGAVCDGSTNDTAAIQAALNSGAAAIFVPPSTAGCKFTTLTMPVAVQGFTFFGVGTGSKLIQTGAGIKWPVNLSIDYHNEVIKDLWIDGTAGTGNTIDTSYEGGVTLRDLYIVNPPVGFAAIYLDGSSTTYTHDDRVLNLQVYGTTAADAGIALGAHNSDALISKFIMNGNFNAVYGIHAYDGAQTTTISDSHPYNTSSYVFYGAGSTTYSQGFIFANDTFDNSHADIVYLSMYRGAVFSGNYFEAVPSGHNAITLSNTIDIAILEPQFQSAGGANYMVQELGSATTTRVVGGSSASIGNFSSQPFQFISPLASAAPGFAGYATLGRYLGWNGVGQAAQTAGTTLFYGPGGSNAAVNNANFNFSGPSGVVTDAFVALTAAPGAGQSLTITLLKNGSTVTAKSGSANPLVLSGASAFSGSIIVDPAFAGASAGDSYSLRVVSSGSAASTIVRYNINGLQ